MSAISAHISCEIPAGDRGLAFGRAQRELIASTVGFYRRLFAEDLALSWPDAGVIATRFADSTAALSPELIDELEGIAMGAGLEQTDVLAINARTELLAGGHYAAGSRPDRFKGTPTSECSAVGISSQLSGGGPFLAQNWDFHPQLTASRVVWMVRTPSVSFATFTEAGLSAKIGINSQGVGCCISLLAHSSDGARDAGAIPIHALCRLLLERCQDVNEAVTLVEATPVAASTCFLIGQSSSGGDEIAVVEKSPVATEVLRVDGDGWLAHTNHFHHPPSIGRDLQLEGSGAADSLFRQAELERRLRGRPRIGRRAIAALLDAGSETAGGVWRRPDPAAPWIERCITLASLILDLRACRLHVRRGLRQRYSAYRPPSPRTVGMLSSRTGK